MLLYSILHLAEVKQADHYGDVVDEPAVPIEHLKRFRQWHSRCPGHPEFGETGADVLRIALAAKRSMETGQAAEP